MCTLCRSLTQPEMEYDCENARYSHPGVRALPGLSMYDQKVGRVWGNVFYVRQSLVPTEKSFLREDGKPFLGGGCYWSASHHCDKITRKVNLQHNRPIMTQSCISWSLGLIVPRAVEGQEHYSGEHVGGQSLPHVCQKAGREKGLRGQTVPTSSYSSPPLKSLAAPISPEVD